MHIVTTDSKNEFNLNSDKLHLLKVNFRNTKIYWLELVDEIPNGELALISFQFPYKAPHNILYRMQKGAWNLHTAPLPEFGG